VRHRPRRAPPRRGRDTDTDTDIDIDIDIDIADVTRTFART
jgi:hypothetical protein